MATPTLSRGFPIDVKRLVTGRLLISAMSGAGKSWAIRRVLEQTVGQIQQIVIDPEGEFYTLRERHSHVLASATPGEGDCIAEIESAHLLARKLLELQTSAVIDIFELADDSRKNAKPGRRAFVDRFVRALVNAPRKLWHPMLIVIDEAQYFAPEGGSSIATDAIANLMTQGRKRGFAGVLATPRIAQLSKNVAAPATNVLIGRVRLDRDVERSTAALGFSGGPRGDDAKRIRSLGDGEFFAYGPAIAPEVSLVKVGPVRTTHPGPGEVAPPSPPAPEAVAKILAQLADLPAAAQAELETVDELRARVSELERDLRNAHKAGPSDTDLARARREGEERAARAYQRAIDTVLARSEAASESLARAQAELAKAVEIVGEPVEFRMPDPAPERLPVQRPSWPPRPTQRPGIRERIDIPGPQQRILDALAWLDACGFPEPVARVQVACVSSYSPNSSGFANALGALRTDGRIEYPSGGMVRLTDSGRSAARTPGAPPTTEALHQRVNGILNGPQRRVLAPLLKAHPQDIARDALAAAAGYSASSSGFANALGSLRTLGLLDYPSSGLVRASDLLFPR